MYLHIHKMLLDWECKIAMTEYQNASVTKCTSLYCICDFFQIMVAFKIVKTKQNQIKALLTISLTNVMCKCISKCIKNVVCPVACFVVESDIVVQLVFQGTM